MIYENEHDKELRELQIELGVSFVEGNKTRFTEITEAITSGDLRAAHRLVHSLKSNAGQIGKNELQNTADVIERLLAKKERPPEDLLEHLEAELNAVLEELGES